MASVGEIPDRSDALLVERIRSRTAALVDALVERKQAYRDIESVMAAAAELVRPLRRLVPLGVVKG